MKIGDFESKLIENQPLNKKIGRKNLLKNYGQLVGQ